MGRSTSCAFWLLIKPLIHTCNLNGLLMFSQENLNLDLTKVDIPGLESTLPSRRARDFVNLANSVEVHRIVSEGVETVPVCRNYAEVTEKVAVGF